jgi:hypothetical protein
LDAEKVSQMVEQLYCSVESLHPQNHLVVVRTCGWDRKHLRYFETRDVVGLKNE